MSVNGSEWTPFEGCKTRFDTHWTEITKLLGNDLLGYIKSQLERASFFSEENRGFGLKLVVDSNIIFSDILGKMKGKPSFLGSIIGNPLLKLYAPPQIREEIKKTIEKDLPKKLDKNQAVLFAEETISKVNILEGDRLDAWYKAYKLIGERDSSDIPFMSLAFSLESHGIITRDLDYLEQHDIKIWTLGKVGSIVSDFSKGSLSFFILGYELPIILQICYSLCIGFLKLLYECIKMIISFVSAIITGAIDIISKIPLWVWEIFLAAVATACIIMIFSKSARQKAGELLDQVNDKLTKFVNKIEELFSNFIDIIKQIIETLKPYVQFGVDAVGYLFHSSYNLMSEMQKLEKQRAKV